MYTIDRDNAKKHHRKTKTRGKGEGPALFCSALLCAPVTAAAAANVNSSVVHEPNTKLYLERIIDLFLMISIFQGRSTVILILPDLQQWLMLPVESRIFRMIYCSTCFLGWICTIGEQILRKLSQRHTIHEYSVRLTWAVLFSRVILVIVAKRHRREMLPYPYHGGQ